MRGEESRKNISFSDLIRVLQEVDKKSLIKKSSTSLSYDFNLTITFLRKNGLDRHICFPSSERGLPRNSERGIYNWIKNILIRKLDIKLDSLDAHLDWSSQADWGPTSSVAWHFEECRFEPGSPNTARIHFPRLGSFRFYKNEFDFGASRGGRSWAFIFAGKSRVIFQKNNFKNSDILIVYSLLDEDSKDSDVRKLSWEGREAHIVRDKSYYEAMIRKNYQLPESVRLITPGAGPEHLGLDSLSFLGNKGIDDLNLRCNASSYVFRGINHINFIRFEEPYSDFPNLDGKIYIGPRERIDPHFHYPLHHRSLFSSMKEFAGKRQDAWLVNVLDKQLDRIEYFLTKDQEVSFFADKREWFEYWQDRILYAWRRWSSDFYRSWLRPLSMVVLGYGALNAFPYFWIEDFTFADWIAFSLRPVSQIHLYTGSLEAVCGGEYKGLPLRSKNWLGFIGLLQMIWIAVWGFAFSKSIKR